MSIVTNNPWPIEEVLHHDFTKAEAAQLSDVRREAAAVLLARSGCLADAVTVYNGVDPVHEVDKAHFDTLSPKEEFDELFSRSIVGVHAAEVLLGSVCHPGYFDSRHSRRVREISKSGDWYKAALRTGLVVGEETPHHNIAEYIQQIANREISTDQLHVMSQSTEMLSSALTWWQVIMAKMQRADPDSYKTDHHLQDILHNNQNELITGAVLLQRLVKAKAFDHKDFGIESEDTLERAAIGLRAQWRTSGKMLHPYFRIANEATIGTDLHELLDTVHEAFIEKGIIDTKKYKKGTVKGLLHEAMWFIDAQMLVVSQPDQFGTTAISPAAQRFDRPIIGYPEQLRGFDYGIADISDHDSVTHLVNLKSGDKYPKEYHPRIKQVIESGFDIGERSLLAKLAAYRKIIDSGFTHPDTEKWLQKYALATARQELEPYRKASIEPGWALL